MASSIAAPAAPCGGTFDFVIAGGGTAGLTLAARLTEDASRTVAVIEAGGDRSQDLIVTCGGLTSSQFGNPEYDWAFTTAPQVRLAPLHYSLFRSKLMPGC